MNFENKCNLQKTRITRTSQNSCFENNQAYETAPACCFTNSPFCGLLIKHWMAVTQLRIFDQNNVAKRCTYKICELEIRSQNFEFTENKCVSHQFLSQFYAIWTVTKLPDGHKVTSGHPEKIFQENTHEIFPSFKLQVKIIS